MIQFNVFEAEDSLSRGRARKKEPVLRVMQSAV
jgi:hypothetical protein